MNNKLRYFGLILATVFFLFPNYHVQAQIVVDFTTMTDSQTFGNHAQKEISPGVFALWAGDTNGDGKVKLQGADNDALQIKSEILAHPSNAANNLGFSYSTYSNADVNLDGVVDYQGANNDYQHIKDMATLMHPANKFDVLTFIILQQLP